MKRLLYIVIMLSLVALQGCEKKPVPAPAGSLTITGERTLVRLNCHQGDEATITFTAKCDWCISTSGEGFAVSPSSGAGSEEPQSITIRTTADNSGATLLHRGSATIILKDYPATKHTVKVVQCAPSERTYIVYMFGTSLSYYLNNNVKCIAEALNEDILGNDRLLAFIQNSRTKGVVKEIYHDKKRGEAVTDIVREIALPTTLTDSGFAEHLAMMMDIAPAERYAMIVGGHSSAWLPAAPVSEGIPLSMGVGYTPNWQPAPGGEVTRTIGEHNMRLQIDEFASALTLAGQHFDWIYFDVCFMSSLEAAYALRSNTDYIVGSPCEIMGYGSPYEVMLDELVKDDLDGASREYHNFYTNDYYGSKSGCLSTIVCAELDALASTVKALNANAVANSFDIAEVQPFEGREAHVFFDAESYMVQAHEEQSLVEAFVAQLNNTVINRYRTEKFYSTYNARMNEIFYYSGVNMTPDEACVALLDEQLAAMNTDIEAKRLEREHLKTELEGAGVAPESSERYNALTAQISELAKQITKLQNQSKELKHYNPSLKETAWYKATH